MKVIILKPNRSQNEPITINCDSSFRTFFNYNSSFNFCIKLNHIKELIDLINKLSPTSKQTIVKIFLISLLPFKLDKRAPEYPPVNEPNIRITNKFIGKEPILIK